jgi:hypothetical protein
MSTTPTTFILNFRKDGSATILGRVTARNGSGAATSKFGEGNYIKSADVSAITCNAYDITAAPTTPISITVDSTAFVTAVTAVPDFLWTYDSVGYNFIHDIASSTFTSGGHAYEVDYKITLTGGAVLWGIGQGTAHDQQGS